MLLKFGLESSCPNTGVTTARAEVMAAHADKRRNIDFGYCSLAARAVEGDRTCSICPHERRGWPHVRPRSKTSFTLFCVPNPQLFLEFVFDVFLMVVNAIEM